MATARAVATPASPDITMPSQPSGLSSAKNPVLLATILRNEVMESPGSSVAWAAPFGIGEVRFISASRGALEPIQDRNHWNRRKLVTGARIAVQRSRRGFIVRAERGRYSGGSRAGPRENSDVNSNGFAAGLRPGRSNLCPSAGDGLGAYPGAYGARNQHQGYRFGTAQLAYPGHPDRQLLPQPVRTAAAVLRPDRAGAAAAPCRPRDGAAVMGIRGHALCSCRNFRDLE